MSPIKNRHSDYVTKLLVLRLLSDVDRLIAEGRYSSRIEAVRVAPDQLLDELKHQVEVSTHALVAEDPW